MQVNPAVDTEEVGQSREGRSRSASVWSVTLNTHREKREREAGEVTHWM